MNPTKRLLLGARPSVIHSTSNELPTQGKRDKRYRQTRGTERVSTINEFTLFRDQRRNRTFTGARSLPSTFHFFFFFEYWPFKFFNTFSHDQEFVEIVQNAWSSSITGNPILYSG